MRLTDRRADTTVILDFETTGLSPDYGDRAIETLIGVGSQLFLILETIVIRPRYSSGGKVAITSFAGKAFAPFSDIFIKHYEATGRTAPPLSWKRLATEELIREQFKAVGINNVEIHHEPLGYQMTDSQNWWDVVWNAGWRSLLNQLTDEEQKAFEKEHIKEISNVLGSDGVWFNTEVLIAIGVK